MANDVEDLFDERLKNITDTLKPWEVLAFRSLIQDFTFDVIGEIELTRYLRLLFGLEEDNLYDPKIDDEKPNEDVTNVFAKIKGRSQKVRELLKAIEESLSPSEIRIYSSLCEDFKSHKIGFSKFFTSLLRLIKKHKYLHQSFAEFAYGDQENQEDVVVGVGETTQEDAEEGEIREDNLNDPKIGTSLEVRVKVDDESPKEEESENDVSNVKIRKKKKVIKVTPNYNLIPEEKQCPVPNTVLNNTCALRKVDTQGFKERAGYDERMNCEDDMYETDMLMEYLEIAVKRAEKVMSGEMSIEDIGYHFYRCAKALYGEDMFDTVRENHQKALPVILNRLKQKLRETTDVQKSWKPVWKQYIEKTSAKQRDSVARGHRKM